MKSEFKKLSENFIKIANKKWIMSVNKGTGSVGLTFENELQKDADSLFFPDYNGIELKCTTRFSRFPFSLFSISFDGPTFPEIDRIVSLYGYCDYKYYDKKVLRVDINFVEKRISHNYQFKLKLNKNSNKIYLEVFNLEGKLIDDKSFVYLDNVIERLNLKLRNLVIIHGSRKVVEECEYFRYYEMDEYKLKDTSTFIKLLENGKIFVTLESRIGKSGLNDGKYKNKNLVFKIKRDDIEELFTKISTINTDYNINRLENDTSNFYIMR